MPTQNKVVLFFTIVIIVVAIGYLEHSKVHPISGTTGTTTALALTGSENVASSTPSSPSSDGASTTIPTAAQITQIRAQKALKYPSAVEIADSTGFVNTPGATLTQSGMPIDLSQYIGKDVILIDFMTYSCINCQRTFPYLEAWYTKYKDQGLIVIGIHTPEFEFEKVYNNVAQAMQRFGITFPVVLDSNYGTWNAYQNEYWPHEFLIDIDGYIREDHIGEGGYDTTEQNIQALLNERDSRLGITPTFSTSLVNPSTAVTSIQTNSPETYFGSNRNQYLGNGTVGQSGVQSFNVPTTKLAQNTFYFGGSWNVLPEFAESQGNTSSITYNYSAMNVYFVAGLAPSHDGVMAEVTLDGAPIPSNLRGSDIIVQNGKTYIDVTSDRLYNLIKDTSMNSHTIQITAEGAGLDAYTFTFG